MRCLATWFSLVAIVADIMFLMSSVPIVDIGTLCLELVGVVEVSLQAVGEVGGESEQGQSCLVHRKTD